MRRRVLVIAAAFLLFAGTAAAEEKGPADTAEQDGDTIFNLGAVRVASSRLRTERSAEPAVNVPESVTVLGLETLETSASGYLPEKISTAEGVTYTDIQGQGLGAHVDLRGFGGDVQNALALFDGVRAVEPFDNSITWPLYPAEYFQEVEIRRGGASTIYGEGALSGVIRLETKEPTKEWHVATENSYGSFRTQRDFVEVSGTASGIGVYAGARYLNTDGYRQNSGHESSSALLKVTADLSELLSVKNSLYHIDNETGIPGPLSFQEMEADRRQKDPDGQFGDKFNDVLTQDSLLISYFAEPIGIEFSDQIGYRLREQDSLQSFGGSFPGTSINKIATETYSNVLQATGKYEGEGLSSETSAGFEWSIDDIHNPFLFIDPVFGPFSTDRSIDRRFLGYFVQNRLTLRERWVVELGARYDDIDWNIYDLLSPQAQKRKAADHVSPKLALEYKFTDALSAFAGVSESFKVPDSNALIFETPNIFSPNPNVDPSVAHHEEIGVRYAHPLLGSLRAVYFHIETKKEILFNDIANTNQNFDTQRQGVELGGEWSWGKGLETFVRYDYTEALFDNGTFDRKAIPLVPRSKWTMGFLWRPDGHWSVGGQAQGVLDQFALNDFNNVFPVDDYWTLDGRVSYRVKNWEIFFKAGNILGEKYSSFVTSNGVDTVNFNPAPEQTLEAGFRMDI